VLGATYRGCDLLGELAENVKAGIDDESVADKMNSVEEQQTVDVLQKPLKTSLRRSLSLVMLSELVTPVSLCDSEMSPSRVGRCAVNVDRHVSTVSGCHGKECSAAVDVVDPEEHRFDVSLNDSVTEIPPLSQRLRLNQLLSHSAVNDCILSRKPVTNELPVSDDIAPRRDNSKNFCLKKSSQRTGNSESAMTYSVSGRKPEELPMSDDITASRRDNLKKTRLKKLSQRTGNSDSAVLPSRRRQALMLRTTAILSDLDVFVDSAKLPGATTNASSPEKDVPQFDRLGKLKDNVTESEIVQKFQRSLHITCKNEDPESVAGNTSCLSQHNQMSESSVQFISADNCATTDTVFLPVDTPTDPNISSQPFSGPSIWSPRHCGNFCIETSIIDTSVAVVDSSDRNKNIVQVHTLPVSEMNSLTNTTNTHCNNVSPVISGNDRNVYADTDEGSGNGDPIDMSELLFDDPDSPEDNSLLSSDSFKQHCGISVSNSGNTHCNNVDCSVIVID